MALYHPPKKIKTKCSKCEHECELKKPHDWLPHCDGRAMDFCPKCGYFTLKYQMGIELTDAFNKAIKELSERAN